MEPVDASILRAKSMLSKAIASSSDPYGSVQESEQVVEPMDDSDRVSEDLFKSSTDNSE